MCSQRSSVGGRNLGVQKVAADDGVSRPVVEPLATPAAVIDPRSAGGCLLGRCPHTPGPHSGDNPERSCSVAGEGASAITVQLTGGSLMYPAGKAQLRGTPASSATSASSRPESTSRARCACTGVSTRRCSRPARRAAGIGGVPLYGSAVCCSPRISPESVAPVPHWVSEAARERRDERQMVVARL